MNLNSTSPQNSNFMDFLLKASSPIASSNSHMNSNQTSPITNINRNTIQSKVYDDIFDMPIFQQDDDINDIIDSNLNDEIIEYMINSNQRNIKLGNDTLLSLIIPDKYYNSNNSLIKSSNMNSIITFIRQMEYELKYYYKLNQQNNQNNQINEKQLTMFFLGKHSINKANVFLKILKFLKQVIVGIDKQYESQPLDLLIRSCQILDCFGCLQQRDYSSRYGKYCEIMYSVHYDMLDIHHWNMIPLWFDISRITNTNSFGNYNIFFMLVNELYRYDRNLAQALKLYKSRFKILTYTNTNTNINDDNHCISFDILVENLKAFGIVTEELHALWTIMSCILHLGNTHISIRKSSIQGSIKHRQVVFDYDFMNNRTENILEVEDIAALLEIPFSELESFLLTRRLSVYSDKKTFVINEIYHQIHRLMNFMYSRVLCFLNQRCCQSLPLVNSNNNLKKLSTFHLADYPGYEDLGTNKNTLDTLLINYIHERLCQNLFLNKLISSNDTITNSFTWDYLDQIERIFPLINTFSMISELQVGDDMGLLVAIEEMKAKAFTLVRNESSKLKCCFLIHHYQNVSKQMNSIQYNLDNCIDSNCIESSILSKVLTLSNNKYLRDIFRLVDLGKFPLLIFSWSCNKIQACLP